MPIPLLIWCVAGVIAAVVAIKKGFFKKKVFIYGMKATGKTTFHKYCTTGNIIKEYFPTGTGEFDKKAILDKTKAKWKEWIGGWTIIDSAGQFKDLQIAGGEIIALTSKGTFYSKTQGRTWLFRSK